MFSKKPKNEKSEVDIAFTIYEKIFITLSNITSTEKVIYKKGDLEKKENDFSEQEKSHLDLLSKKVDVEMFKEAQLNNIELSRRVYWLNWVLGIFTIILAVVALVELLFKS